MKKKIVIGILAHVDAGKTTLSEALLYVSGKIRQLGRVDHKNTFLDTNIIERERGITIFSKQARFSTDSCDFILLDTPGHTDLSAETERTLSLLDYAVLVISASDGVQNHTRTLWQLLEFYDIPTFIFVNKTDISINLMEDIQAELVGALSPKCVAFYENQTKIELDERLALIHETFLDDFLSGEEIDNSGIAKLVSSRELFPCFFGSALKLVGIDFFLNHISSLVLSPRYESEGFGAKAYKISRIGSTRLTYIKVTRGKLSVRDELSYISADGRRFAEKISQIRLYSGDKFEQVESVSAGDICAVLGLSATYVGQGLGLELDNGEPIIEPILSYRLKLPEDCDPMLYFPKLKELEEEEPSLHLYWNEELRQIEARLMGDIQIELIKRLILDRFSISCDIDCGNILYKEKIAKKTIGVGHFEPLRHYAEVQFLLEPLPKGSGLIFDVNIPENSLDTNWQRLILSNLYEHTHRGILIGAPLTDTKITLVAGRAHLKHTDGGDFREATLRAVRQGLMKAGCILLEPYYSFRIDIPAASVGRAVADLQARSASFEIVNSDIEKTQISGRGAVAKLQDYAREIISYTGGKGRISCVFDGYYPCLEADEIIASAAYDPEADLSDTPHSVFCANGSGHIVHWRDVDSHKHIDVTLTDDEKVKQIIPTVSTLAKKYSLSNEEVEEIMLREFGPIRRKKYSEPKINAAKNAKYPKSKKSVETKRQMLIIDGYNIIYSSDALREIADYSLEKARQTLMDILSNYVSYTKTELVLVFDAYLVKDGTGSDFMHDGYRVVYTKEDQTADTFIEIMMRELGPDYNIKVVTGDGLMQFSALRSGILRMTAKEFWDDVQKIANEISDFIRKLRDAR